jgi:hypothetical protein
LDKGVTGVTGTKIHFISILLRVGNSSYIDQLRIRRNRNRIRRHIQSNYCIFGVEESQGDVVALGTVNNQETKVKFFDASGPELIPMNLSRGSGHILEYVTPVGTVNDHISP